MREKIGSKENYEKIGPTAWGVAYMRSLSDIKYAGEIFKELEVKIKPADSAGADYLETIRSSRLAPQLEARFKLINNLLQGNKTDQILEIAAGLSPRGLSMTEDHSLKYVEVDLPEMARNKRQIVERVSFRTNLERPNLYIEAGDALDLDSLLSAAEHFEKRPISIVNEGLMRYLNFEQKAAVARNVHALLEKFGGAWITPDITLKRVIDHEQESEDNRKKVMVLSGIDIENNSFNNEKEAKLFFENLGFKIERHGFSEASPQLTSPRKLGLTPGEVQKLLQDPVVFVMRIK